MHNYLMMTVLAMILTQGPAFAQTAITWETLSDVVFTDKFSKEVDGYYLFPTFGKSLVALQGKEVYITGYMIPLDPASGIHILSANTYSNCFFCGAAGPESIIELHLKPGHRVFKMDERVVIKGKLKLNSLNVYQCNYLLQEAEEYVK